MILSYIPRKTVIWVVTWDWDPKVQRILFNNAGCDSREKGDKRGRGGLWDECARGHYGHCKHHIHWLDNVTPSDRLSGEQPFRRRTTRSRWNQSKQHLSNPGRQLDVEPATLQLRIGYLLQGGVGMRLKTKQEVEKQRNKRGLVWPKVMGIWAKESELDVALLSWTTWERLLIFMNTGFHFLYSRQLKNR